MGQEEPGQIVDLEGEFVTIGALLPPILDDPGIVHQHVEPRLAGEDCVGHALDIGEGREIRQIEPGLRAARLCTCATTASPRARSRPCTRSLAPRWARTVATPRPSPSVPPVIRTTLPARSRAMQTL
jgi:hypothetical protein